MLKSLIDWYLTSLDSGGYPLVFLLMALESSIVPIPSEVIVPPAAHLANTTGNFSYVGIVLAGTAGSWFGAAVMYWASRMAGRPLISRFGKYFFISESKIEQAELWSAKHGAFGVFLARLLPVIRHLIGIPAGLVRMNFKVYSIFTLIGSAIWCSVLCWVGVKAGGDPKLIQGDMHQVAIWLIGALAVISVLYYFLVHRTIAQEKTRIRTATNP